MSMAMMLGNQVPATRFRFELFEWPMCFGGRPRHIIRKRRNHRWRANNRSPFQVGQQPTTPDSHMNATN